ITSLAEYIHNNQLKNPLVSLKVIITWAAPLYNHEKNLIKSVFQCDVTNIYGTRELGHIAALCPEGQMHLNQEKYIVENNHEAPNHQGLSELLVTPLIKTPMPFIRYHTGDIGEAKYSYCNCGRTTQVIDNFLGRTGEIFYTKDNRMISPNFWCRTFMDEKRAQAIKRFQVIYKKDKTMLIRLVKNKNFTNQTENDLRNYLIENNFKEDDFKFQYETDIKPMVSGKYQMVVKE
ncbi:MAG: hypothetical protein MJB14_06840, partial [Spirochaetes bacterium]|nr:hypothetical protein [Spirochaetota bacterium]